MTGFTMGAVVEAPYDDTVARVRGLLTEAGFGVLTEIDLQQTLRAKLGVEVPSQVILGACRPPLAYEALRADSRIATLLPCNVVVTEESAGATRVEVLDPAMMTSFSPALAEVADDARHRLSGMLAALNDEGGAA